MSDPAPLHGHRPFTPMTRGAARAVVTLFVLSLVLAGLNFTWTANEVNTATTQARAMCQFDVHLGTAPLPLPARAAMPTRLGVTIIADARAAFRQAGCTGRLPPPDPSFARWAKFYKLPAD